MSAINCLFANLMGIKNNYNISINGRHAADIARSLSKLKKDLLLKKLSALDEEKRALVFSYFYDDIQQSLVDIMSDEEVAAILSCMSVVDASDVFREIEDGRRNKILSLVTNDKVKDILNISSYEEDETGSVMTSDYICLPGDLTVKQAIDMLRIRAKNKENVYEIYIVNSNKKLMGVISLRSLLLASNQLTRLERLIDKEKQLVTAKATDTREETALKLSRYDVNSIPVVDSKNHLIGIVTGEQAIDVVESELTEDFLKSASISEMDESLPEASLFTLYRKRVVWLVLLVFGNIFSGAGIAFFENTIAKNVTLIFFLPLLIDSAGNAGSQSATLMIRSLALGEVKLKNLGKLFAKEILVSMGLALSMALAVSGIGFYRGGFVIASVVAITMFLTVIIGSMMGFSLPFLLSKFNLDPASASSPLITTLADTLGVVVYFTVATWMLDL